MRWITITCWVKGANLKVSIADTGSGVTHEGRGQAFQPYVHHQG